MELPFAIKKGQGRYLMTLVQGFVKRMCWHADSASSVYWWSLQTGCTAPIVDLGSRHLVHQGRRVLRTPLQVPRIL